MDGRKQRYPQKSRLTRALLTRFSFAFFGFTAVYAIVGFLVWRGVTSVTWYPEDSTYLFLHWIKMHLWLITAVIFIVAWSAITYHFLLKPLRYLDELMAAAGQLAISPNEPILLSAELKEMQDELNRIREQAVRNEFLAKEAEQRKNDLIVYLAHDLKTPLTSVIGYLNLLYEEPQISTELRAKYTGIALGKAERLEDLINEFFDITRFNLTTISLETGQLNLSRMLEQITFEFEPILAKKNMRWQTTIEPGVVIVGDADKLERVFDNLIRNAVNYGYEDTEIFLSMQSLEEEIELTVKNHGRTIPPDKLERIFEQFFRLDSSRATATGGAGLGLAISKEIVEKHGGSIRAESADERTSFVVRLPKQYSIVSNNSEKHGS